MSNDDYLAKGLAAMAEAMTARLDGLLAQPDDKFLQFAAEADAQGAADLILARQDAELAGDTALVAALDAGQVAIEKGLPLPAVCVVILATGFHANGFQEADVILRFKAALSDKMFDAELAKLRAADLWPWATDTPTEQED